MKPPDFTVEHLKQLPLRAIVAFAARCARRVEHLAQRPEVDPMAERQRAAIESALRLAEDFARGADTPPDPAVVEAIDAVRAVSGDPPSGQGAAAAAAQAAHAAASAWQTFETREVERYKPLGGRTADVRSFLGALAHITVELAALDAFTAAMNAYSAAGERQPQFVAAALNDYDRLLQLKLGHYPELGDPVDPSPGGPLGPL